MVEGGVDWIGKMDEVRLKDCLSGIKKIQKSLIRRSAGGTRAYYVFIEQYV